MENKNQEKELDLLDLIKICFGFFKDYILKPLAVLVKIAFKRWYILFAAVLIGVVVSVVVPKYIIKENKAELILKNNVSISSSYIKEVEVLSSMNRARLANLLQVEPEVLENLVALKPHMVISSDSSLINYMVDEQDIMKADNSKYRVHPSMFSIEILSKDTASLPIFAEAVIDYINERSSFSDLNTRRITTMRNELRTFKNEIQILDSLRYIQYFTNDANQVVLGTSGETFNIKDKNQWIQSDLMNLKSRVIGLETKLGSDTLAIDKVTTLSMSDVYNNHPFKTAPKYCIFLLVFSYILVLLYEFKGNIKEWLKK